MKLRDYFHMYSEAARDFYRNPWVIIPGAILWAFILALGRVSVEVNYKLTTTLGLSIWLIIFYLLIMIGMGFIFSGLIGMAKEKKGLEVFLRNGKRFWWRNFLVLLVVSVVSLVLGRIVHVVVFYFGKAVGLGTVAATVIFGLLYFASLVGIVIFLMFGSFCVVVFEVGVLEGLKKSVEIVKKNYFLSLDIAVFFFVLLFVLNLFTGVLLDALEYLIVVPYLALVLTRFVLQTGRRM